jgi:hypothetical protein
MQVYITVDVELWPSNWSDYKLQFSEAYKRYILGETKDGIHGLPYQLQVLSKYNLKAVFFVESLFASQFGLARLEQIVNMIQNAGQQVQIHAHPEWVHHMDKPFLETNGRYHLARFDCAEQSELIHAAKKNLIAAGAPDVFAFRAGSFSANNDTILALQKNNIPIDSSVNISIEGAQGEFGFMNEPGFIGDIIELPLTNYRDRPGHMRALQVAGSSYGEFKSILKSGIASGLESVVLLSHSAELLNSARNGVDYFAVSRFEKMCQYLSKNSDTLLTKHLSEKMNPPRPNRAGETLSTQWHVSANRVAQQILRRIVY